MRIVPAGGRITPARLRYDRTYNSLQEVPLRIRSLSVPRHSHGKQTLGNPCVFSGAIAGAADRNFLIRFQHALALFPDDTG